MSDEMLLKVVRARVAELAHANGTMPTARTTGISKHLVMKLCSDLPVRQSSVLTAARALGLIATVPTPAALSSVPNASDLGA